jgi:hypothetical protein
MFAESIDFCLFEGLVFEVLVFVEVVWYGLFVRVMTSSCSNINLFREVRRGYGGAGREFVKVGLDCAAAASSSLRPRRDVRYC